MPSPRLPSIKLTIKICIVAVAIAAIVFAQLGPGDWQVRTGLGWQTADLISVMELMREGRKRIPFDRAVNTASTRRQPRASVVFDFAKTYQEATSWSFYI